MSANKRRRIKFANRFDLATSATTVPKTDYQKVVYDTLSALWARATWIAAGLAVALAFASIALVLVGPRYTGHAMIQFNFLREEPSTGTRVQSTATIDPIAVIDSAAPVIRSRATANAVVTRLGLDKDPAFAHGSLAWRIVSSIRSLLGFSQTRLSDHDLAESQLMRRITVTSNPRSYLTSISVEATEPERAAQLANAVALEYLRGKLLQQLSDSYAAAERQMIDISSTYGVRHQAYQRELTKLEYLQARVRELREKSFDEEAASQVSGLSFVAAQKVMIPSGPNIPLVLGLTAVVALATSSWLALKPWSKIAWRDKLRRMTPALSSLAGRLPILSERTLARVRQLMRRGERPPPGSLNDTEVGSTEHALG